MSAIVFAYEPEGVVARGLRDDWLEARAAGQDRERTAFLRQILRRRVRRGTGFRGASHPLGEALRPERRSDYATSGANDSSLFPVPPVDDSLVPVLRHVDGLVDPNIQRDAGWVDPPSRAIPPSPTFTTGTPVVRMSEGAVLVSSAVWELLCSIRESLASGDRTPDGNRRRLAAIKPLALAAGAELDDFLTHSTVVMPREIQLYLERDTRDGEQVLTVEPTFANARPDGSSDSITSRSATCTASRWARITARSSSIPT